MRWGSAAPPVGRHGTVLIPIRLDTFWHCCPCASGVHTPKTGFAIGIPRRGGLTGE